jgi:hypothetical protein
VVVAFIAALIALANADSSRIGVDDFVEYWSAGRLNLSGGNPYSPEQMMVLQLSVNWDEERPLMMWNPPPTLALVMPFGLMPYVPARMLWLAISTMLVMIAADRLWFLYGGAAERRWLALLCAVTFLPTLFVLQIGQIGVWILIGVVGFLLFAHKGRWLAAGALFALTTIKPHVAYLMWVALALWWLYKPRWKFAVGGVGVVAIAWAIVMLVNPQVKAQYLDATLNAPPLYWRTMTWGMVLRLIFGFDREWLQLVTPVMGAVWLVFWWLPRRNEWDWLGETPRLLLVSASTMAFGWFFDLVVLLPAVVQMGVWLSRETNRVLRRNVLILYAVLQLVAWGVNRARFDALYFVWFAPALLLLYLYYSARRSPQRNALSLDSSTTELSRAGGFDMAPAKD